MTVRSAPFRAFFLALLLLAVAAPLSAGAFGTPAEGAAGKDTVTLTLVVTGTGNVQPGVGVHTYARGETVYVSANPVAGSGFAFDEWRGDLTGIETFAPIVMDGDKSVEAVFVAGDWTLTIQHGGAGSGMTFPGPGLYSYLDGRRAGLSAGASGGSCFAGWQGAATGYDMFVAVLMNADKAITALFEPGGHSLTIASSGQGNTSPSSGNSYWYVEGAFICANAYPQNDAWRFDHWEGDIGDWGPDYFMLCVTMDQNRTVTAFFVEREEYTLTVDVAGSGATEPDVGVHPYLEGDFVSMSATPDDGWVFDHWEGDFGDTNPVVPTCSFAMNENREVTAVFTEAVERTLTLNVSGNGTTEPEAGVHTYLDGDQADLYAVPALGWRFDHWDGDLGDVDPNRASITLFMVQDREVTAVFTAYDHLLTIGVVGAGATAPEPGVYGYDDGAIVYVTAAPDPGQAFDHWEGDIGAADPADPGLHIVMDGDKTVAAVFVEGDWELTLAHGGSGSGQTFPFGPGTYSFVDGRTVDLRATPEVGHYFGGWQGAAAGFSNRIQVLMDSDKTVTALFETAGHTLTVSVLGEGATSPVPGTYALVAGASLALHAFPTNAGWRFDHWEGEVGDADIFAADLSLAIDQDRAVTAVFGQIPNYTLEFGVVGNGETNLEPGTYVYPEGQALNLWAIPAEGWRFDHWEGDVGDAIPTAVSINLTMDQDRNVTAVFGQYDHTLEICVSGDGATAPPQGFYGYDHGDQICVSALPAPGAAFVRWEGDTGSADPFAPSLSLTMDMDRVVTAYFAEEPLYHSADSNADGVVNLSEVLRVVQFLNSDGYHCAEEGIEDGYAPGEGGRSCTPHSSDYNPKDWRINLSELLRLIQLFNVGGYYACPDEDPPAEDGFCIGLRGHQE